MKRRWLDLGAGAVRRPGTIRADVSRQVRPDIVLDASRPLPFRTAALEAISCYDFLEHIEDIPGIMAELHRVLVPGGVLFVTTPHFSCANAFTDPTHRHRFGWSSFDPFSADHALSHYSTARFRITRRVLRFHGGPIDTIIRRVANRWPQLYEHRLAWIFPAWYLEIEMTAAKPS